MMKLPEGVRQKMVGKTQRREGGILGEVGPQSSTYFVVPDNKLQDVEQLLH
jgi:hypothetical protein